MAQKRILVGGAGGTLLLAWLSFRFFESPFLNLKERLTVRDRPESTQV